MSRLTGYIEGPRAKELLAELDIYDEVTRRIGLRGKSHSLIEELLEGRVVLVVDEVPLKASGDGHYLYTPCIDRGDAE